MTTTTMGRRLRAPSASWWTWLLTTLIVVAPVFGFYNAAKISYWHWLSADWSTDLWWLKLPVGIVLLLCIGYIYTKQRRNFSVPMRVGFIALIVSLIVIPFGAGLMDINALSVDLLVLLVQIALTAYGILALRWAHFDFRISRTRSTFDADTYEAESAEAQHHNEEHHR